MSYTNNGINAAIIEENHYYPFGLKHKKYGSVDKDLVCVDEDCYEVGIDVVPPQARKTYQYKYNGKEFQDELNLNVYDFGNRLYMPDLARWKTLDRKSDATGQIHSSPYAYTLNNPVLYTDPNGDCPPGVNCENVLENMERIRVNRASNLGPGNTRNNGTKFHAGHDLYAPVGANVRSSMAGTVHATGYSASYGNYVTVKTTHTEHIPTGEYTLRGDIILPVTEAKTTTYYAFYSHLDTVGVETGQSVSAGENIGTLGVSGNASNLSGDDVHLHFEIGTALRSSSSPFIAKNSLLDPNIAYKDVNFTSQAPSAKNQSDKGIIKTIFGNNGSETYIFQNFNTNNPNRNGTDQPWQFPMPIPQ